MVDGELPRIRGLKARSVIVPMARPLRTGGGSVSAAPLVLIDVETDAGVIGRAYVFTYGAFALTPVATMIENLSEMIAGDPLAPLKVDEKLRGRLRLLGAQGVALMALAGIDQALWDASAKLHGLPLVKMLGAEPIPLPAYNSNGLALSGPETVAAEAIELVEPGFPAVKLRLGYANARDDRRAYHAVRKAVGDDVRVMTDYNQCLSPAEAEVRVRNLEGEDIEWIEEPVRFDDYAGCARLREKARLPIQIGENCWGLHDMQKAFDVEACDFFMADAIKIGGVSGWLRAQALADGQNVPLSSHLYPEVSAHLLAASPTRHWLEYVDWAAPVLADPIVPAVDGTVTAADRPGIGIEWEWLCENAPIGLESWRLLWRSG